MPLRREQPAKAEGGREPRSCGAVEVLSFLLSSVLAHPCLATSKSVTSFCEVTDQAGICFVAPGQMAPKPPLQDSLAADLSETNQMNQISCSKLCAMATSWKQRSHFPKSQTLCPDARNSRLGGPKPADAAVLCGGT